MEWIDVKDRLPEKYRFVDVALGSSENPDYYQRKTSILYNDSDVNRGRRKGFVVTLWAGEEVTHWMPLPGKPKG